MAAGPVRQGMTLGDSGASRTPFLQPVSPALANISDPAVHVKASGRRSTSSSGVSVPPVNTVMSRSISAAVRARLNDIGLALDRLADDEALRQVMEF